MICDYLTSQNFRDFGACSELVMFVSFILFIIFVRYFYELLS